MNLIPRNYYDWNPDFHQWRARRRPQAQYWPRWYWWYRRAKHWMNEVIEP